jgi:hypothetical protein
MRLKTQGMTLCLWYKFASLAGSSQTLFEMSNGYGTEHVYIRRLADTSDLVFGVDHTSSQYKVYVLGLCRCVLHSI